VTANLRVLAMIGLDEINISDDPFFFEVLLAPLVVATHVC